MIGYEAILFSHWYMIGYIAVLRFPLWYMIGYKTILRYSLWYVIGYKVIRRLSLWYMIGYKAKTKIFSLLYKIFVISSEKLSFVTNVFDIT